LVDPYVQTAVAGTNGLMYVSLVGRLSEYPIPTLNLPPAAGATLLDIGCNWGRWCIAAGRLGYSPVGIDPSLEAVQAARRVAAQLGVPARFVVGDGRFLPFRDGLFDVTFSYSVLQHFSGPDLRATLAQVRRVLHPGGRSLIQMANALGLRCLYHQLRRRFREPADFDVRYWTPWQLLGTFRELVGPSELAVDGVLTLNPQASEAHLLPWRFRAVVGLSMWWRRLAARFPLLARVADSLYVTSCKMS
jgi:SAM-dependent methyltransferase